MLKVNIKLEILMNTNIKKNIECIGFLEKITIKLENILIIIKILFI